MLHYYLIHSLSRINCPNLLSRLAKSAWSWTLGKCATLAYNASYAANNNAISVFSSFINYTITNLSIKNGSTKVGNAVNVIWPGVLSWTMRKYRNKDRIKGLLMIVKW